MKTGSRSSEEQSSSGKHHKKTGRVGKIIKTVILVIVAIIVVGIGFALGCIKGIIDDGPSIDDIDVSPDAYYTTIYDTDGNVTETLVEAGSNRVFVAYDDMPSNAVNAFVAIEDKDYWNHGGISIIGIFRAASGLLTGGELSQGASTITQQLIKNSVFNGGMEENFSDKVVRKIQEQHLAIQLSKRMSKEEILENYLNTINLGHNCLGVGTAAQRYFGKSIDELSLSEVTVLAAITSNPSYYDPINHPENNAERRAIVLADMVDQEYITQEQADEASADNVYERIAAYNTQYQEEDNGIYSAFTDSLVTQVLQDLQDELGYSYSEAQHLLYSGGLSIYSTQDSSAQTIVDNHINDESYYNNAQYGISSYALSVQDASGEVTNYSEGHIKLQLGLSSLVFSSQEAAQAAIDQFKSLVVGEGCEILGENSQITLQPQVSFVLMNQSNGHVLALSNGRGEKTSSLSLQRATASTRQPGSVMKVIAAFAPALDAQGASLSTVFYDAPTTYSGKNIGNWWGGTYTGYSNIRQGITYSMNVVAVRCLMEMVSPTLAMQYAENFGLTTLVESQTLSDGTELTDLTASMALGGLTYGVKNIEITGAYAAIANGGVYNEPILYTKIVDRNGNVLINHEEDQESHRVIKETTAWLLTSAMQDSTQPHSYYTLGIGSTSTRAAIAGMSVAGKSGTTSDSNDQWFVGFTPYYTAGIWIGYDDNGTLSGADPIIKNIWRDIMSDMTVGVGLADTGFPQPSGITTATVCSRCGKLAVGGLCDQDPRGVVYTEYFDRDSLPTQSCDCHIQVEVCSVTGLLPSDDCEQTEMRTFMSAELVGGGTYDSSFASPTETCTECTGAASVEDETDANGSIRHGSSSGSSSGSHSSGNSSGGSSTSSGSGSSSSSGSTSGGASSSETQ